MEDMHVLDHFDFGLVSQQHHRRNHYNSVDPFLDMTDTQFKRKYRMSKESFQKLFSLLDNKLVASTNTRDKPTSTRRQLLIALRFYAVGTFHDVTGEMAGHSKSHVSDIVARVSQLLSSMTKDFIHFPSKSDALKVSHIFAQKQISSLIVV